MVFFIPEREIALSAALSDPLVSIHTSYTTLVGFQLYVNTDWIDSRERNVKTVVVYTGNNEDSIVVCGLEFGSLTNMNVKENRIEGGGIEENILDLFIKEYESLGFQAKEIPLPSGQDVSKETTLLNVPELAKIYTGSPKQFTTSTSTFYQLPEGDVVQYTDLVQIQFNMKKLGVGERSGSVLKDASDIQMERVGHLFNLKLAGPSFPKMFEKLCYVIQQSLVYLGLLPLMFPVDGLLCSATSEAMRKFKGHGEEQQSASEFEDGILCTKEDLDLLVGRVQAYCSKLDLVGFSISENIFAFPDHVHRRIRKFQKEKHLVVTQVFDEATVFCLNNTSDAKSRLAQPVAVVSSTVSNLKNKVEEFAGLRYDNQNHSQESLTEVAHDPKIMSEMQNHIKCMIKRETQLVEKEIRRQKKSTRPKEMLMLQFEGAIEEGKTFPSRMFKGFRQSTTKRLGEIASKGKTMKKNVTLGVKHLMQGATSSDENSESDDLNEENQARNARNADTKIRRSIDELAIHSESDSPGNYPPYASNYPLQNAFSGTKLNSLDFKNISPPQPLNTQQSPPAHTATRNASIPSNLFSTSPQIPTQSLFVAPSGMTVNTSPSLIAGQSILSTMANLNMPPSSLDMEPSPTKESLRSMSTLSPFDHLQSHLQTSQALQSHNFPSSDASNETPYQIHGSVLESAQSLLLKMNQLDSIVSLMSSISTSFNSTIASVSDEALHARVKSEGMLQRLDVLENQQIQLEKALEGVLKNENLKAKYALEILKEKMSDFEEFKENSFERVLKIEMDVNTRESKIGTAVSSST